MHIYLLNWRDVKHPKSGGAEVLTHGIFRRLADRGHQVTWFCGAFNGSARDETIDGIRVVRAGNALTVRAHAYAFLRHLRGVDVVVDEINTLPFFAPLYAHVPVVSFICQLAREVWFYEAPIGVRHVGHMLEPLYLRPYAQVPTMTISESSARSIREIGLQGKIGIMPMALDQYDAPPPLSLTERDDTIAVLGRVTPSKRLEHSIQALSMLDSRFSSLRLQILGAGSPEVHRKLVALARSAGVEHRIDWHGFVDEPRKRALLRKAKALVMTSAREGWGLAVTEANMAGTPAVAYRVPGLCDSVQDGETGILTEPSPEKLAEGLTRLLSDPSGYAMVASQAQRASRALTWDATASFVEKFLHDIKEAACRTR